MSPLFAVAIWCSKCNRCTLRVFFQRNKPSQDNWTPTLVSHSWFDRSLSIGNVVWTLSGLRGGRNRRRCSCRRPYRRLIAWNMSLILQRNRLVVDCSVKKVIRSVGWIQRRWLVAFRGCQSEKRVFSWKCRWLVWNCTNFSLLFSSKTRNSSSWLCWVTRTVSADVMQPEHAKQSANVISTFSSFCAEPS